MRPFEPVCSHTTVAAGPLTSAAFAAPFEVGSVTVPNRLVLAPMAGISTSAYRRQLKRHGIGLTTSEMVSAYGVLYGDRRTAEYLVFSEEERPFALQLFGERPEVVADAARMVLDRDVRPDLLDVNMGCPVRKVAKTGAGCALMADPAGAAAVARAVVEVALAFGVPVTAKIRSGLDVERVSAVELAQRLEAAGISAVGVHPRTAAQLYRGRADHRVTAAVVAAVGIPVLASGDVTSVATAKSVLDQTGAAAVMLARGVLGDPWLVDDLLLGQERPRPPLEVVVVELRSLLALAEQEMGARRAGPWARKLLRPFLRPSGVPGPTIADLVRLPDARALDAGLGGLVRALPPSR